MSLDNYIFVAGASRGVGREVVNLLVKEGKKVKVLLRSQDYVSELESLGVKIFLGNALDYQTVENAILGEEKIDTVITTVGGMPQGGTRADFLGNKNMIDAAVKAKVNKFILVSSIGAGKSAIALPPQAMEVLKSVLIDKEKAEKHLQNSGLNYTIIRPGGLKSESATGNGILTENYRVSGTIHRADVAQLIYRCLNSNLADNKILSAIDKNMMYGDPNFEELKI